MRWIYRFFAQMHLQYRFSLSMFGVSQRLSLKDIKQCFREMITDATPTKGMHYPLKTWTLAYYQAMHQCYTFIETGTKQADTVELIAPLFRNCYTVEIDKLLYDEWHDRAIKPGNVIHLLGSSGTLLADILEKAQGPCFLWLDAHFELGNPIKSPLSDEITAVLKYLSKIDVVLIDDAHWMEVTSGVTNSLLDTLFESGFTSILYNDIWRFTRRTSAVPSSI